MEQFFKYFLYFLIYSFLGWVMEDILCLIQDKKFVNRGFLIGPICPIYGIGVLIILFLIGNKTNDVLAVFLKCIFICSILEYFTSFIMEKLFKIRWWDYSHSFGNINGRICLSTMIPFGILGSLVIYFIHPAYVLLVNLINKKILVIGGSITVVLFIGDIILSTYILIKIKDKIKIGKKDNTDSVRKQIEKWLKKSNLALYERVIRSFPKFQIINKVKGKKS